MKKDVEMQRIFVGGLFHAVKEDDLKDKFKTFGQVSEVQIIHKKDSEGEIYKTFGYINLHADQQALKKCFALFGRTKWNGFEMRVQVAKEDFMSKLKNEWANPVPEVKKSRKKRIAEPIKSYDEILEKSNKMRKSVPGTLIEGENNWVIGKYGRPLPVVFLSKQSGKKLIKVDPSKHCHCLKKLNVECCGESAENLTWKLTGQSNLEKFQKLINNKENNCQKTCLDKLNDCSFETKEKSKKTVVKNITVDDENIIELENGNSKNKKEKKKRKLNCNKDDDVTEESDVCFDLNEKIESFVSGQNGFTDKLNEDSTKNSELEVNLNETKIDCKKKKIRKACHSNGEEETSIPENKFIDHDASLLKDNCFVDYEDSSDETAEDSTNNNSSLGLSIVEQLLQRKKSLSENSASKVFGKSPNTSFNSKASSDNEEEYKMNIKETDPTDSEEHGSSSCEDELNGNAFNFSLEQLKASQTTLVPNGSFTLSQFSIAEVNEDVYDDSSSNSGNEDTEIETKDEKLESTDSNSQSVNEKTNPEIDSSQGKSIEVKSDIESIPEKVIEEINTKKKVKLNKQNLSKKELKKKHAQSEVMRKQSIVNRSKLIENNNELVRNSLSNLDASNSNVNRIVFNDSDNEMDVDEPGNSGESVNISIDMITTSKSDDFKKNTSTANKSKTKLDLFESDNEDDFEIEENEEDENDLFQIKKQFQGDGGEKLFKLQQRFGNDQRFRLDERFANDVSTELNSGEDDIIDDENLENTEVERDKQFSILEGLLGKSIPKNKKDKTFDRYDPSNDNHEQFEVQLEKEKEVGGPLKETIDDVKEKVETVAVSNDVFFEIDSSIKDLFSKPNENKPVFSFLGETTAVTDKFDDSSKKVELPPEISKKDINWKKALDETKKDSTKTLDGSETVKNRTPSNSAAVKFFFSIDDERLQSGKSFMRNDTLEVIEEQWKALRSGLTESYKKKNKDAIRRVRKLKERKINYK